jgi:hypothetical protein
VGSRALLQRRFEKRIKSQKALFISLGDAQATLLMGVVSVKKV